MKGSCARSVEDSADGVTKNAGFVRYETGVKSIWGDGAPSIEFNIAIDPGRARIRIGEILIAEYVEGEEPAVDLLFVLRTGWLAESMAVKGGVNIDEENLGIFCFTHRLLVYAVDKSYKIIDTLSNRGCKLGRIARKVWRRIESIPIACWILLIEEQPISHDKDLKISIIFD